MTRNWVNKKFKIGEIVQNIRTKALYVIIPDKGCKEPTSQVRVSEVNSKTYIHYKPTSSKGLKKFYATFE